MFVSSDLQNTHIPKSGYRARVTLALILLLTNASCSAVPIDSTAHSPIDVMHSIAASQHHEINSKIVNRPFQLVVRMPLDATSGERYPVVYLLDGGALFPMLAGYQQYLRFEEALPPLIVVAIGYKGGDFTTGNYRSTDYTAPSSERDYWGGASAFHDVLEQEIIPFIETTYPAEPTQRILFGQSLAGQFVLYSALQRPSTFWGRIASNPALHRNLDYFKSAPDGSETSHQQPNYLFLASGSENLAIYQKPALQWLTHWQAQAHTPFELKAMTLQGYGHFSVAPESYRQGLQWLLRQNSVQPGSGISE